MTEIAIVCTDRGQHRRRRLTTAKLWPGGHIGLSSFRGMLPNEGARPGDKMNRDAYRFWCPLCPRKPQIKKSRLWELLDAACQAGLAEFDLSYVD
jgi:hypothetical protein